MLFLHETTAALHPETAFGERGVAIAAILIKGTLIPALLHRAMRDAEMRREMKPIVGYIASLLLGAAATGAALLSVSYRTTPVSTKAIVT